MIFFPLLWQRGQDGFQGGGFTEKSSFASQLLLAIRVTRPVQALQLYVLKVLLACRRGSFQAHPGVWTE